MGLNETVSAERTHIAFFGLRNAGKSSVVNAITTTFNQSALIYGAISLLVGVLVILIGKAMNDDEEYDKEDDYIDEIEQVSTAQ